MNLSPSDSTPPADGGRLIVLTAPLTESIDHAGYFIQMALASLPIWMEGVINRKYPKWREVEHNEDGSARYMPAGVRLVEKSLQREYRAEDIVACFPDDLPKFVGPRTRVVAVSTHNPLGVTFAAGVYTSIFGSSRMPINSHYARQLFAQIKASPYRDNFKVIVGGSGGWQIIQTNTYEELSVDCVVEGRSESADTLELFRKAIDGEPLPKRVDVKHPLDRESIEDWPSVVLEGLRVLNENNWFPAMTLIVGNPGETDEDVRDTIDLVYEMERRGLFGFLIPSIFTPLHDTRMEKETGVTQTKQLTPLQWQLMMKCWKMNLRPGQYSWWGPMAWRVGSLGMWLYKLRALNGPNFTWPLLMFSGAISEKNLQRMGKIYGGKPLKTKNRRELLASLKPKDWQYLRADNGDMPTTGYVPGTAARAMTAR